MWAFKVKIYHASDMESGIREMVARNPNCIIYKQTATLKPIRFIGNKLKDIPMILVRAWDNFASENVARWQREGGLMLYSWHRTEIMPECDAVFFTEAPTQYKQLHDLAKKVRKEIIIYRPPTWDLHKDTIEVKYPTSEVYHTVLLLAKAWCGRQLDGRLQAALDRSGFDPATTAVFEASELEMIAGITETQLKKILRNYKFRGSHERYHCYEPFFPPTEQDALWAYEMLMDNPAMFKGQRFLRFDDPVQGRVLGFRKMLMRCCRNKFVRRHPNIYILNINHKELDMLVVDALANVRRGEWDKMRNIIDQSPDYCLTHRTQPQSSEL